MGGRRLVGQVEPVEPSILGVLTLGLKPKISRSSSEIRSKRSRIMLGVSGSEPNSVCSMNFVGFSKVILNCAAAQYGHCLAFMSAMISL